MEEGQADRVGHHRTAVGVQREQRVQRATAMVRDFRLVGVKAKPKKGNKLLKKPLKTTVILPAGPILELTKLEIEQNPAVTVIPVQFFQFYGFIEIKKVIKMPGKITIKRQISRFLSFFAVYCKFCIVLGPKMIKIHKFFVLNVKKAVLI